MGTYWVLGWFWGKTPFCLGRELKKPPILEIFGGWIFLGPIKIGQKLFFGKIWGFWGCLGEKTPKRAEFFVKTPNFGTLAKGIIFFGIKNLKEKLFFGNFGV